MILDANFGDILRSNGLVDGISWSFKGDIYFDDSVPYETREKVLSLAKSYDPLPGEKTRAKNAIDVAAGSARARYITVAPGQEAVYQLKAAEADAYVAAGRPVDTTAYPILTAEAQARGVTVSQIADVVRSKRDQWMMILAQIESIRISGKLAVDAATNYSEVKTAVDNVFKKLGSV